MRLECTSSSTLLKADTWRLILPGENTEPRLCLSHQLREAESTANNQGEGMCINFKGTCLRSYYGLPLIVHANSGQVICHHFADGPRPAYLPTRTDRTIRQRKAE